MSAPALARGSYGDLVALLQRGLARLGHYTQAIDGDFGGGTERAVKSLQTDTDRTVDGRADPDTWQAATGLPWPELFDRCLQLSARFEGHGYTLIQGNWDGAGLTWGIIGFTLKHGEIQAIVNEVAARAPALLDVAFGANVPALLEHTTSKTKLTSWANSISAGKDKQSVVEPWRSGFAALGAQPLVQELQRRRARVRYFDDACATAARLGLTEERGVALCFDIHVQNGGVKKDDEAAFVAATSGRGAPKTAAGRRGALAQLVADSANPKFRADVLSRKSTIASGQGIVHGGMFVLDAWGFDATI